VNAVLQIPSITFEQVVTSKRIFSLPEVAVEFLKIAQQAEPDLNEVVRVVRADPVISAKILRTINSPLFGLRHRIETLEIAIPRLGMTLLKTIVLGFHLASHQNERVSIKSTLQAHWRSAITQAVFAELIGEKMTGGQPDNYFLAGLLQDIGIIAMISEAPNEYCANVLNRASFPDVVSAERIYFGFSHVEVSCAILEKWGVLECFGDAIQHHHDRIVPPEQSRNLKLAVVLQAATQGTEMLFSTRHSQLTLNTAVKLWTEFLHSRLDIKPVHALEIIEEVRTRVNENCNIFAFDIGGDVCTDRLIQEATELMQEINLNQQIQQAKRLKHQSVNVEQDLLYRDSLCGLYNRRYMNDMMYDLFQQTAQNKQSIAAVFIDVDKFKSINDHYGHATGDLAIQAVAASLRASIRHHDIPIRFGGDEFIIIFVNIAENDFETVLHRLNSNQVKFANEEGIELSLNLSIGGIYMSPKSGDVPNPNWMIDQADQAMYHAKRNGGGQHSIRKFHGTQLVEQADGAR
jgi:diguanylate cyclase (GGDEF)-like protein